MRIVHLSTMSSYFGGEVHLASLAEGLMNRGHEVVCVVRPGSDLAAVLPRRGLDTRTLPLVDWYDPLSVARLSSLLHQLDCQILHTHLPRDYFLAAVATLGSPVVNVGTRHQLRPLSHAVFKRPFLNRFAGFIAVSEAVRQGLEQVGAVSSANLEVIHNGIDLPPENPALGPAGTRLRLQAGVSPDDPLIGFVGRLCPTKGIETLIQAVARLRPRWPRLKLCLVVGETVGTGYRAQLTDLVHRLGLDDRVVFAGYIDEAARLSGAFDIQTVPSLAEPFGLVSLEAMAAGVPLVVTDSGGSPEIVRDGVEGFLVPPADEEVLARKLDCLLDSPGLRMEMGQRGRLRVKADFCRSRMLDKTEELYRRVLDLPEPARREASA